MARSARARRPLWARLSQPPRLRSRSGSGRHSRRAPPSSCALERPAQVIGSVFPPLGPATIGAAIEQPASSLSRQARRPRERPEAPAAFCVAGRELENCREDRASRRAQRLRIVALQLGRLLSGGRAHSGPIIGCRESAGPAAKCLRPAYHQQAHHLGRRRDLVCARPHGHATWPRRRAAAQSARRGADICANICARPLTQ